VQYTAAGQLSQVTYVGGRSADLQRAAAIDAADRAAATSSTQRDLEYRYSATNNNERITQMKDWVTGEEMGQRTGWCGRTRPAPREHAVPAPSMTSENG